MFEVRRYAAANGVDLIGRWLEGLRDRQAVARVLKRVDRLERGLFGDCKPCGAGVWELRVDWGPGYRVYYARAGATIILLLCGGDKTTQQADILKAQGYWNDYTKRQKKDRR